MTSKLYGEKGGKSSSSKTSSINEAPNTLQSNSIARILDVIGEGEIVGLVDGMKSVYLDDTPLQNEDDSYNFSGVEIETRTGTPDQSYIPGFPAVEVATSISTQVRQATPVIRTLTDESLTAARVTILIPALTEQNTSTGDIKGSNAAIGIDVRPSGGDWTEVIYNDIRGKTTSDYERTYRFPLDGQAPWDIRVRRITPDSDSSFINNDTYWSTLTSIIDAKLTYPDTALVGITVNAEDFGDSIPSRSYLVKGRIIQVPSNYNPTTRAYSGIWDGTFKMAWTDNPAWIYYDIATNKRFGAGIENVDKWGLYTIGQYCDELVPNGYGDDEPRFTFNTALTSQEEAFDALSLISSCFRGMTYWGTNTVVAVADMPSDPAKLVTPSNVIDGNFEYSGTALSARHSQVLVTWNDPDSNYEEAIEVVEDADLIEKYGIRQTDITAVGCTSRGQARRMGLWLLYSEKAETETVSYQASIDHVDIRPGDIVKISDPSIAGARLGGRVRVTGTTELELDKRPDETSGQDWFLDVVMPAGGIETREVSSFDGNKITLSQPLSQEPVVAAQWILRSTSVEPRQFRVLSITEDGDNIYTVTGVEYDPTKYARVEQGLILDDPDYSLLPSGAISAPYNITAVTSTYIAGNTQHQKLTISWTASDDPRVQTYQCEYISPDDATWQSGYNNSGLSFDLMDITPGEWQIRVRGMSALGVASPWVSLTTAISGLLEPNAPTAVDVEVGTFQIKLSPSGGKAGQEWQYWRSDVALADESLIETNAVLRTQTSGFYTDTGLDPLTTYYYYIRGANNYGVSGWYPVQATTEGDASAILAALTDKITEGQLYQDLNDRLDKIEVNEAAIETEATTRQTEDESLATQITTVQSQLGDDLVLLEQSLGTEIDAIDGTVSALYTLRTDVNGRISGFGLSNDGVESEFGIVADRFYIADPDNSGTNEVIPFIFDNGTAYIQEALIGSLTFNKLTDDTGTFIVQNGKIQAEYLSVTGLEVEWADIQNVDIVTADIRDATITSAKIDDLAVTSAKIGDAAVDTLQLAGNAVTTPVGSYTSGNATLGASSAWVTVQSVTINPQQAPVSLIFNATANISVGTFDNPPGGSGSASAYASATLQARLMKNGAQLIYFGNVGFGEDFVETVDSQAEATARIDTIFSGGYLDSVAGASRTYSLQLRVIGDWNQNVSTLVSARFMQALGVKR